MTTMSSSPVAPPSSPSRQLRRVIVRVTIGSFSVAALMGIAALLAGGSFGETEGRILLTTLLVGVVSVGVLCYLATAGRPFQPVGVAGGAVVLVPFVTGLVMIWSSADSEPLGRTFGVGAVVAATLAQACLLLSLGDGASRLVRRLLVATLAAAALVAVTVSWLIIWSQDPPEGLLRALGVVAILDVLGTVTVAALAKFGGPAGAAGRAAPTLELPPELRDRLEREAAARGRQPQEMATEAVERYLHDL
jgi:hypothetical protein